MNLTQHSQAVVTRSVRGEYIVVAKRAHAIPESITSPLLRLRQTAKRELDSIAAFRRGYSFRCMCFRGGTYCFTAADENRLRIWRSQHDSFNMFAEVGFSRICTYLGQKWMNLAEHRKNLTMCGEKRVGVDRGRSHE